MSHRKVLSQSTVPFLWEEIPGVPKPILVHSFNRLPLALPPNRNSTTPKIGPDHELKIPLPPRPELQPIYKRSSSSKGHALEQEDPFLAALKQCTKSAISGKEPGGSKNGGRTDHLGLKARKIKLSFSCMRSCEVRVDNRVRFPAGWKMGL